MKLMEILMKQDDDRFLRKKKFKECFERIQEKRPVLQGKIPYYELRDECAASYCQDVSKKKKFARDLCLHKCISPECFAIAYDFDPKEIVQQTPEEEEEERKARKMEFIRCIETNMLSNVEERKEGCILRGYCKDMEKKSFERELCLHHCINPECFNSTYFNMKIDSSKNQKQIDILRYNLKSQFLECAEKKLPENRKSKKYHTYQKMRDECAPECPHFEQENQIERDICIHKCMNIICFYEIYSDFRRAHFDSQDPKAQNFIVESLRARFIYCFESDIPKEATSKKYMRRLRTCEFKYALDLPYLNNTEEEELIYKCINLNCFLSIFQNYIIGQNFSILYFEVTQEEKKELKNYFVDCVQQPSNSIVPNYQELRIQCLETLCMEYSKDQKLEKDICVHDCIDKECFLQIYGDIYQDLQKFKSQQGLQNETNTRKERFLICLRDSIKQKKQLNKIERRMKNVSVNQEIKKIDNNDQINDNENLQDEDNYSIHEEVNYTQGEIESSQSTDTDINHKSDL